MKTLNPLISDRPLIFLDAESTGLDPARDRLVSLACLKMTPADLFRLDGEEQREWRFNPKQLMSPEVIAVHGITNEAAAREQPFGFWATEIHQFIRGSDLAGFNLQNFDLPLLWEEFYRTGYRWEMAGLRILDAGTIFKKKEERTLGAALQFYCQKQLNGAHQASNDVEATRQVLWGQLQRYPELANIDQIAAFSKMDERVDLAGKIIMKNGVPVYNLRRVQDVPVADDPGFAEWMLAHDFSQNTKLWLRRILGWETLEDAAQPQDPF